MDVEEEEEEEVDEDVEEENGSQDGKHTLRELARSKCTWTCHKSHLVWKLTGKMPDPNPATYVLCERAQSKRTWTFEKSKCVWKFTRKMPDPNPGDIVLCEPAQSKCTWTCHKTHFVWKLQGKCRTSVLGHRFVRACAVEMHTDISQEPFCAEIYRENAGRAGYHLDYRKNPFSVATLFGK